MDILQLDHFKVSLFQALGLTQSSINSLLCSNILLENLSLLWLDWSTLNHDPMKDKIKGSIWILGGSPIAPKHPRKPYKRQNQFQECTGMEWGKVEKIFSALFIMLGLHWPNLNVDLVFGSLQWKLCWATIRRKDGSRHFLKKRIPICCHI